MRYGFTTGSCAAAAAKAAAWMLLTGKEKQTITISTPKGIAYTAQLEETERMQERVSCAVRKDSGDDPDITNGVLVCAAVSCLPAVLQSDDCNQNEDGSIRKDQIGNEGPKKQTKDGSIIIKGGEGIGRVTCPGLEQPVGAAAINRVPREMIQREVQEVCRLADYNGSLLVEISIPGGRELAAKTFNPRLGIVDGLSVLGTSGIVEAMSSKALLDTIRVELRVKRAAGLRKIAVSPGNYGQDYLRRNWNYDLDKSVKCSNFIGDTLDMAAEEGFEEVLLLGHIGKLIKLSGGIMNTHSKEGDCRMELLAAAAIRAGVPERLLPCLLNCLTTEQAVALLGSCGKQEEVMRIVMEQAMFYLKKRAAGRLEVQCMMYSQEAGELARSEGAAAVLAYLTKQETAEMFD